MLRGFGKKRYDPHLDEYIAFSRNHCTNQRCNESGWGVRRETWSTASSWSANTWSKATESLHGEYGYEIYSMAPFRAPDSKRTPPTGAPSF